MNLTPFRQLLACSAVFAAPVLAQETSARVVQVHVTSVSGRNVYLDKGRSQGLQQGMIVRLFPPGQGQIDLEVRTVSSSSARAELPAGLEPPPVGTRGEFTVDPGSASTAAPVRTGNDGKPVPEHPPWTRQEQPRSPDQPLLVPTYGQRPDERPFTLDGRMYASTMWNRDNGNGRADEYSLSRLGTYAEGHNAFGYGDRTRIAGEFDDRRVSVLGEPQEVDQNGRLDLASVAFGTEHWAPFGLEAGRFFSEHLPELGLVDGAESVMRFDSGLRVGAGAGSYPLPYPGRDTGADLGTHAFIDWCADDRRSFAAAAGVQKTWHEGTPDRDLLILRTEGRPSDSFWLYANAKIDLYTSSDTLKGAGAEVTEFYGQGRYDTKDWGTGVSVSQFRWPELLREEYQNLSPDLVRDGHVERLSGSWWGRTSERLRLSARADLWRDQSDSGTALDFGADYRDALGEGSLLSAAVFTSQGSYLSGPGLRLTLQEPLGAVLTRFGYRIFRYDITSLIDGSETYIRQSAELGASWAVGNFDMDLSAERWFGDQEDAFAVTLFAQWRF